MLSQALLNYPELLLYICSVAAISAVPQDLVVLVHGKLDLAEKYLDL